ncbi:MAG: glycosyltransferase family 4 protein [Thermoguttaceae bacterium]
MIYKPPSGETRPLPFGRSPSRPLRILRLLISIRETTASYNQFSLPLRDEQEITLCTFFPTEIRMPKEIRLFDGDGTVRGYFRVLKAAMAQREYDVVHAHSPHVGCFFLMATVLRRRARRSSVCTVHNSYRSFKLRNRLLLLPVFAGFSRVVCCGLASYRSFPPWFKWLAGKRLSFVPNGVDIGRVDRAVQSGEARTAAEDFAVVSVARLIDVKHPGTVLHAFRKVDDRKSRLTFLGEGLLGGQLADDILAHGLNHRVTLGGLVAREAVYETLRTADLFVSASAGEGLPIAVLEAMACRVPVLLSDIPPHREIADGVDFIPLVAVEDVDGFAREMRTFQEMPPSQRAAIGEQCRRLVLRRFSLPVMHRGYETIYRELADKSAR